MPPYILNQYNILNVLLRCVKLPHPRLLTFTYTHTLLTTLRSTQTINVQGTLRAIQIRNSLTSEYGVTIQNNIRDVLYSHNFSNYMWNIKKLNEVN